MNKLRYGPEFFSLLGTRRFGIPFALFYAAILCILVGSTQIATAQASLGYGAGEFTQRLARLERLIEKERQRLQIPGLAVVIVHHDQVVFQKGFGFRDIEAQLPVTSDSLFGIGSCTKAFTGLVAVMSADAGKLSLDDSPKKFLPYFQLADPKADAQVTLLDMLTHRTGLKTLDDEV
jgi:CubicO group peptidase (beta-lactamase class C family)